VTLEFDNTQNRLVTEYDVTGLSVDYAVRITGYKLSKEFEDGLIVANTIKDGIRTVGRFDEKSGENTYLVFVGMVNSRINNLLLIDGSFAFMYEKTHKVKNFVYELFDLVGKKIYRFDTSCEANDGYFVDKNTFVLNADKAIAVMDFVGAEVLALSMASDAIFDADGKPL
jgi:hypothetical protein